MATRKYPKRLICYGDGLYIMEKEQLEIKVEISHDYIFEEIDRIIDEKTLLTPVEIFRDAVENLLKHKYTFGNIRNKPKVEGKYYSIHDQDYYIVFKDYIMAQEKYRKKSDEVTYRRKIMNENKRKHREFEELMRRR